MPFFNARCRERPRRANLFALSVILILARSSLAQPPVSSPAQALEAATGGSPESAKATVVKMTLHPAAAPMPALRYHLLPEVRDLKPGNAALLYQRAQSLEWWSQFIRSGEGEKMANLLDMPLRRMPREKVVLVTNALAEMDLAARRETCDWEMTPRLREEGFSLLLPDVQGFRTFSHMLALRARLDMLDGRLDQAVVDMQTGFALSRHVGEAPIIVSALVGMAIGHTMFDQLEEFVQLEKAPNLFWALADLPRPFIDLHRPLQGEKVGIASTFPDIRAALRDPTRPPVPMQTIHKYLDNLRYVGDNVAGDRLAFTLMAARTYPTAKKYLLEKGFSAEQIGTLPVIQVALMHGLAVIDESYDDVYKWQSFPYWQARPGMAKARQNFDRMRMEQPETMYLASMLMPALNNVIFAKARMERRPAMLQVVEALRLHAANEGKLPSRLEDIQAVPIPADPITGRPFEYTLEANRALLYAPPPAGEAVNDRNAIRYELTLAPATKH